MLFGVNPIMWSNDDLHALGDHISLEQCLQEAQNAGFTGIELGRKMPKSAEQLGPLLKRHGLQLISGWYSCRLLERDLDAEWQASTTHRTLLKELGCTVFIIAEVARSTHGDIHIPLNKRPMLAEHEWPTWSQKIENFARRLHDEGFITAYHHHMGTVIQTEAEISRLMATTETLGLLYDTGHLAAAGANLLQVWQQHASRIRHVHLKDIDSARLTELLAQNGSFLDGVKAGVFRTPGEGDIDFSTILKKMHNSYAGTWLVVEADQDARQFPPGPCADRAYQNLKTWWPS